MTYKEYDEEAIQGDLNKIIEAKQVRIEQLEGVEALNKRLVAFVRDVEAYARVTELREGARALLASIETGDNT